VRERVHALDVARRSTSVTAVRRRTCTPKHAGDRQSMRRAEVLLCMTLAGPLAGATRHAPTGRTALTFAARRPPLVAHRAHVAAP
jgi:hypothetical protein